MESNGTEQGEGTQTGTEQTTKVDGKFAGIVRAQRAEFRQSVAGVVAARGSVSVKQGIAGTMLGTGEASLRQGYTTCLATWGKAEVHQGGTQWLFTGKGVEIDQGGALMVAAPKVQLRRGFIGLALAQHVELDESSKLIFTPASAAALGAVLGAVFGLLSIVGLFARKR